MHEVVKLLRSNTPTHPAVLWLLIQALRERIGEEEGEKTYEWMEFIEMLSADYKITVSERNMLAINILLTSEYIAEKQAELPDTTETEAELSMGILYPNTHPKELAEITLSHTDFNEYLLLIVVSGGHVFSLRDLARIYFGLSAKHDDLDLSLAGVAYTNLVEDTVQQLHELGIHSGVDLDLESGDTRTFAINKETLIDRSAHVLDSLIVVLQQEGETHPGLQGFRTTLD